MREHILYVIISYDASGSPIGFQYRDGSYARDDWDVFWYQKNLQGDIIAIYDNTGKREMTYNYTAWGHMVTSNCLDIDFDNPFTYRGYYYDHDLRLYYLNSRYYDSTNCRFINADYALYHQMLGYNMFAYCNNDPVNYVDYSGENSDVLGWWFSIAGSIALAEPTCVGEIVVVVVGAVIAIGVLLYAEEQLDDVKIVPPQSLPDTEDGEEAESDVPEVDDSLDSDRDVFDKNNLPVKGEPNSDRNLYDKQGLKQTRHYGPDGKAEYDIDYHHPGKHKFPHRHNWDWSLPKPRLDGIDVF